jgi:hypothetical protein
LSELTNKPPEPPPEQPEARDSKPSAKEYEKYLNLAPYDYKLSASDQALTRQGLNKFDFPNQDAWQDKPVNPDSGLDIEPGEISSVGVWMAKNSEGEFSGFGVLEANLHVDRPGLLPGGEDVAFDPEKYKEGVQIRESPERLYYFQFQKPCDIAVAKTDANIQHGEGGIYQVFVPDIKERMADTDGTLVQPDWAKKTGAEMKPGGLGPEQSHLV